MLRMEEKKDIRTEVQERIKYFTYEQSLHLAWLCSVRILPFIEARSFRYSKKARQNHILTFFEAVDLVSFVAFASSLTVEIDTTTYTVARTLATKIHTIISDIKPKITHSSLDTHTTLTTQHPLAASYTTAHTIYIAVCAIIAATSRDYYNVDFDTATATASAATAAVATSAFTYGIKREKFEKILFSDIEKIRANKFVMFDIDESIYGSAFINFIRLLEDIGGGYWAKLYAKLFETGFVVDINELERRIAVPDEIKAHGVAAVGEYLERLGDNIERLNEARIIILGDKGAGKTSIARKLVDIYADMPDEKESTEGVTVLPWKISGRQYNSNDVNVHIWDFAGHAITHSAHRCFMSARCLYIYVYNGREERDSYPSYWLEQIRIYGGNSPVLFLINIRDGHKTDIARKTLKDDYPFIIGYYDVDISNENKCELKKFRQLVIDKVRNNPSWNSQEISTDAYRIKEDLRIRFENSAIDSIPIEEFNAIAQKNGTPNKKHEQILKDLHTLGICFWYDNDDMRDFNMLVLNPDWITNGIYRIINWGFNNNKYILSINDSSRIFIEDGDMARYPREKIRFLFKLMRTYELAFFKGNNGSQVFVPGLLPNDRPDKLPKFEEKNDRLTMSFTVDKALPPNITSRLIVRRNEEIKNESELWRRGAVLYHPEGKAMALIVEDMRSIVVRVKGNDKTPYIAQLRETLKDIFESYKKLEPDLSYEVLIPEKDVHQSVTLPMPSANEKPLMLKEVIINGHVNAGEPFYFEAESGTKILLIPTINNYLIGDTNMGNKITTFGDNSPVASAKEHSNAIITINNAVNLTELQFLIAEVRKHIGESQREEQEEMIEALEVIEEEAKKEKPRKMIIRSMRNLLISITGSLTASLLNSAIINLIEFLDKIIN